MAGTSIVLLDTPVPAGAAAAATLLLSEEEEEAPGMPPWSLRTICRMESNVWPEILSRQMGQVGIWAGRRGY